MIQMKKFLNTLNKMNIKLSNWSIEEIDDHLVFSFNGEKRMILSKTGDLHIKEDIVYCSKFTKEALDDWETYSKNLQEEWRGKRFNC